MNSASIDNEDLAPVPAESPMYEFTLAGEKISLCEEQQMTTSYTWVIGSDASVICTISYSTEGPDGEEQDGQWELNIHLE